MGDSVSWYPRTTSMNSFAITANELELPGDATHSLQHFGAQCLEVSGVRHRKHLKHKGQRRQPREYLKTDELTEPAFQAVPRDTRLLVLGYHKANAGNAKKGRQSAHIQ